MRVVCGVFAILATLSASTATAQPIEQKLSLPREHRGKSIEVPATLMLPPGTGKVPAVVVHHGSGGVTQSREFAYAKEMVAMGVAALVIDSFTPRNIKTTVSDQSSVSALEMTADTFAALKALAAHPRIQADRIGHFGFSKGGTVSLYAALERNRSRWSSPGLRFAVHVPFYPACNNHYLKPRSTGAPVYMLLGADDTYAGVEPCTQYADIMRKAGWNVDVKIYPGARHGWDTPTAYNVASGENWSGCVFLEQPDRSWQERSTGTVVFDASGKRNEEGYKKALAACRTSGVSGGPNPAAKAASMADLKAILKRHLLDGK